MPAWMFQNTKRGVSSVVVVRLFLLLAQQLSQLQAKPPVTLALVLGMSSLLSVLTVPVNMLQNKH